MWSPETLDSDKNVLSVGQVCEQRNSFQSDWITSRVIRKTRCLVYRYYCLNEINQMFPMMRVIECVYTGVYQMGQKEGTGKCSGQQ